MVIAERRNKIMNQVSLAAVSLQYVTKLNHTEYAVVNLYVIVSAIETYGCGYSNILHWQHHVDETDDNVLIDVAFCLLEIK